MTHSLLASVRELRGLVDEVATIDWRHPTWWMAILAIASFERWPERRRRRLEADYLTSNGDPHADTFMAIPSPLCDAAIEVAAAVTRARAAWDALVALDTQLPDQPLLCELDSRSLLTRRAPLTEPRRVVFATPTGTYLASLDESADNDSSLVAELAAACVAGQQTAHRLVAMDAGSGPPPGAAIAVSLLVEEASTARHAHRRGWNRGGGPWLGLARTKDLSLVTTSHMVVDGFGHGLIAEKVLSTPVPDALVAVARRHLGKSPLEAAPPLSRAMPLGIATGEIAFHPRFFELVYATGWALEKTYRRDWSPAERRAARFTPSLQVPVAPGEPTDSARLRRRVAPGLLSLRMHDGELELPSALRARLGPLLIREAAAAGILGRVRAAAVRLPVPAALKRRSVATGATPSRLVPPIEVLAGRGCLSSLRIPAVEAGTESPSPLPVFAVSAPAISASSDESKGGSVVTVVRYGSGCAITVSGTGIAGTQSGAQEFLSEWLRGLARARELTTPADAAPLAG